MKVNRTNTSDWQSDLLKAVLKLQKQAAIELNEKGLPTTIKRTVFEVYEHANGWGVTPQKRYVSALQSEQIYQKSDQDTGKWLSKLIERYLGEFGPRLASTNQNLLAHAPTTASNLKPSEIIYDFYLEPLAEHYLLTVKDLAQPNKQFLNRLICELAAVDANKYDQHHVQLHGLIVKNKLIYKGTTLRPLTIAERSAFIPDDSAVNLDTDMSMPTSFDDAMPDTLVIFNSSEVSNKTNIVDRFILGCYLMGFNIGSVGTASQLANPAWLKYHTIYYEAGVKKRYSDTKYDFKKKDLINVVDIVEKMTPMILEDSREAIILNRCLKGNGARNEREGFLDFVICLESALLPNLKTELSYKFALHGSLFLKDIFDSKTTFKELKDIYDLRSDIVHGAPIKGDKEAVYKNAKRLATNVTRVCLQKGYPSLDELQLLVINRL